jgi:hypothetical protein
MANDDHLDKEISGELSVTESGGKVKVKSRFIAAVDRLGGNLIDAASVPIEKWTITRRAKNEGERQLIEAAAKYGVDRMGIDQEFATRALENHFGKAFRSQENKDAVLTEALTDLRDNPGTGSDEGPSQPDPVFLDRFETYASEASSEELRSRWGRVLAAEIRKPGTFSNKVLRVVDELDSGTAQLFKSVCDRALVEGDALCEGLLEALSFEDIVSLTTAGLIVEPGLGHKKSLSTVTLADGARVAFIESSNHWVGFKVDVKAPGSYFENKSMIWKEDDIFNVAIYLLTDVGVAISTILFGNADDRFRRLADWVAGIFPDAEIYIFDVVAGNPRRARLVDTLPPKIQSRAEAQ